MCLPQTVGALQQSFSRRDFFKLGAACAATAALAPSVSLAQAGRTINAGMIVDLTHTWGLNTPLFPGSVQPTIELFVSIAQNGYYGNIVSYWEHTGTHMDAPSHFIEGGAYVDQLAVTSLVAPLCVVDIKAKVAAEPASQVMIDDLVAWEQQYGRLPDGAALFMNSGWATRWGDPAAYVNADSTNTLLFSGFSLEAVEFLLAERNVVGIGVDTLSLDYGPATAFVAHSAWLGAGRWGLENVANLDSVPPVGASVVVAPTKMAAGSGGPTRILAMY
jgi:kynurenine formamidase